MIVNKIYVKTSDYSWTNEISDAFLFEIRSITLSMMSTSQDSNSKTRKFLLR